MTDVTQGQDATDATPAEKPDVDTLFGTKSVDDLFPSNYKAPDPVNRNASPLHDYIFSSPLHAPSRVLDAFGYGFKQDWGAGNQSLSEADEYLRKAGVYNDYAKGQRNIIKAANEAIMRPAVSAILAAKSVMGGVMHGAQEAVVKAGEEVGAPNLAREVAAVPEAFPTGFHGATGTPRFGEMPHTITQAKELNVIGAGEAGYFGTKAVEAEAPAVTAHDAKVEGAAQAEGLPGHDAEAGPSPVAKTEATAQAEAPAAVAAPDIHAVARQIAPDTFHEFDALAQKKDTFRRWISELRETRDADAHANAPHQAEIADLQGKLEGATPRLAKKYNERLEPLIAERDAYIADKTKADSADMAKVRQQLMETDYRMRDLAPDVSKAYRDAEARIPQTEATHVDTANIRPKLASEGVETARSEPEGSQATEKAESPAATAATSTPEGSERPSDGADKPATSSAAAVEPAKTVTTSPRDVTQQLPIAHAPSIVADVAQKLKAAGRPAEEADAAGQIVAAYWETRAQRFEGAKGTAAEMYARETPDIVAGKEKPSKVKKARELELAQGVQGRIRVRDEGRNTITLMKTADASTFIHETGHDWLDRMLKDSKDEAAPEVLKNDAQTVLKWLGADSHEAIKTSHHEKFARGFETYIMEGRAPSSVLARVFAKFKDWLTTIYKTVKALKSPISDDIRGVFDRLLAEKPEKTVIVPERETPSGLTEKHGALVESTPPERAHGVANTIEAERDSHAAKNLVENGDNDTRFADTGAETEGRAPGSAQSSGDANAAGAVGGEAETAGGPGGVGEGGSEAADQGTRARKESERLNTAPTPLLRFIAQKGGIRSNDALIGDLRQSLGGQNRLISGFGQLIRNHKTLSGSARKAGRSEALTIDRAREAAIEAGLVPEGTTITQFLDAIDNEVRGIGNPIERAHDPAEQAHAEHSFLEGLNDTVKEAGGVELSDAERARALELHNQEGLNDPHAILERLALEARDAEAGTDLPEHLEGIPGWNVVAPGWDEISADSRAASDHGGSLAPAESEQSSSAAARSGRPNETGAQLSPTADLPTSETHLIDKAGNIRLDNLGTPEDVNAVIRATAEANDDFNAARRNVIPDSEVLALAEALGMGVEQLSQRKLGQAFNAEQIVAARKLLIKSAGDVRDAAAKIAGGTEADVMAYAQARARHLMIQEQVSGITAEAGRALRAFRDLGGSKEAADLSAFLQNTQGKTLYQMKEEGALLAMMGTPQQVSKAVHEADLTRYQKIRAGVLSWFINNLISGPVTHGGYIVGNITTQLFKATVDTSVAAAYGAFRDLPPGERVYFAEVGAQLYGMVRGMRDGYSPAITALKTGVPYMKGDVGGMIGQIEAAHRPQAIPGKAGYVLETPSRAVTAIHTMHYSMNYESEIARRAFRSAMKDELEPGTAAFNTKIAEFTQSPPATEMEAAHNEALKMVLMKSAQFGTAQYHLQRAVNSNILAKIVMPFMQVGANILHESFIERTPLGLVSQTVRDNLTGKNGEVAKHSQASRIAVGIGISTAVIGLTSEGILTGGGPSDHKQLAIKEMTGWRPYSIKVGESYVPYRKYLGGLGPLIAGTADIYEVGHTLSEEGLTKAAAGSLFGFAEVIADESWAKGLSNFIDAARHWDRDGSRYLRNIAADFIPFSIGLQQISTVSDPYRREVRTMLDSARAHIPGMSQGLFPVRDIWGEPIESHTALGPSHVNNDPATKALLDAAYYPGKLERKIRGVELTDQQYDDFTRLGGRMARMRMNALTNTPGFSQMPKQIQAEKIKDIIEHARESARSMIIMQSVNGPNDIMAKARDTKLAKIKGEPAKPETVH